LSVRGGLIVNPPRILPTRKTDEIDRSVSLKDTGLQSVEYSEAPAAQALTADHGVEDGRTSL
jgi:hypothetical protein